MDRGSTNNRPRTLYVWTLRIVLRFEKWIRSSRRDNVRMKRGLEVNEYGVMWWRERRG